MKLICDFWISIVVRFLMFMKRLSGGFAKNLLWSQLGDQQNQLRLSSRNYGESIRLTQIQDIAGCRVIVAGIVDQDKTVQALTNLFERTTIVDRRQQSSHGYRAVHVVVNSNGKMIEIQVRTSLQHLWAELSEKFSDVVDPAIKYGGGNWNAQAVFLTKASAAVAGVESLEMRLAERQEQLRRISEENRTEESGQQTLNANIEAADPLEIIKSIQEAITGLFREATESVEKFKEAVSKHI